MKKFLLLSLIVTLFACSVPAAENVQQVGTNTAASNVVTVTMPKGATGSGELLIAFTGENNNSTQTVTISDSAGTNTWTQVTGYSGVAGALRCNMYFALNSNPVTTVTATWTAGTPNTYLKVYAVSGAATTSLIDGTPLGPSVGNSYTLASGTITTTVNTDLIIYGVFNASGTGSDTLSNSFIFPTNGQAVRIDVGCLPAQGMAGYSTTLTSASQRNMAGQFAAFKAAGGTGTNSCTWALTSPVKMVPMVLEVLTNMFKLPWLKEGRR